MVYGVRYIRSELTGHIYSGKHRDGEMPHGVGFFPVGDRNRAKPQYGIVELEERDSDPNIRRI
jgi:hypothetical protein